MSKKETKKGPLTSPRGMHDILENNYYKYQGLFEKAQEVAVYYGFKPIEIPVLEHEEVFTSSVGVGTDIVDKEMYTLRTRGGDRLSMRPEGTAGVMRAYLQHGMQSFPQPVMLYYYGPFFRHDNPQKGRLRELRQFGLEVLGTEKSIADAMIIRMTHTILSEAGIKNPVLEINSIGDKECRPTYVRELVNYYKKHSNKICEDCRERIKINPLRVLDCKKPECLPIKEGAPDPVGHLCQPCKHHFKEVLEYLEEVGIPYNLNKNLVRGLNYYTRTVFEFSSEAVEGIEQLSLAAGGRYDYLARALDGKRDVPSVGVSLGIDRIVLSPLYANLAPRIMKKPKIFFIQLGSEAKMKSLNVIEIMRKSKIPVHHSLSKDSLGSQLSAAEKLNIPYVMILGQKEAIESSVIVRQKENPVLRQITREVPIKDIQSAKIKKIIAQMKKALASQADGVAIAAPQIGNAMRIVIISGKVFDARFRRDARLPDGQKIQKVKNWPPDITLINPKITKLSKEKKWLPEGCLSVRPWWGDVRRSEKTTITAYDETGKKFRKFTNMKFVFFGTPEFAVDILEELKKAGFLPALVITAPDRPKGRKLILTPPPVKIWAEQNSIPYIQPEKLTPSAFGTSPLLRGRMGGGLDSFDLFIVVAYGKIMPEELINLPRIGTINIHYSLLPKYRGAAPVEAAILAGDRETGVSVQQMEFKLDSGPILAEEKTLIGPDETAPELGKRLTELGAALLVKILPGITGGKINPRPQDESGAIYCKKIKKEDGLVDLNEPAKILWYKYRAYFGWPGLYFFAGDKRVIIKEATYADGVFLIKKVLPEGRKIMDYQNFLREIKTNTWK